MRTWLRILSALSLSAVAVAAQEPPRFSAHADLVLLHVAVTSRNSQYVPGLTRDAFTVYEDDVAQPIVLFSAEDTPATVGLLIDDSASMFGLRNLVAAGAGTFTATSNDADEVFALTFNDQVRPVLPSTTPFTGDGAVLQLHLQRAMATRGRTALYDAVAAGLEQLGRGTHPRKVLVILSDGGDNASITMTLAQTVNAAVTSNTVIYTVVLFDPADPTAQPGLLKRLARASGGIAFEPREPNAVGDALARIARDIRASYSIGYVSPPGLPGRRQVRVVARASNGSVLRARTRSEYVVR